MYCVACGKENSNYSTFCTNCGARLVQGEEVERRHTNKAPIRRSKYVWYIVIGFLLYLVSNLFAYDLHLYLNSKRDYEITGLGIGLGVFGYGLAIFGWIMILYAVRRLIALSKYPSNDC